MSKQIKKKKPTKKVNWGFFNKLNNWLVYLFLLFLPTQLGKHFFLSFSYLSGVRVDYLAPVIYLTDLLAVALIIFNFKSVLKVILNKWVLSFLLLFVIGGYFADVPGIFLYSFSKIVELIAVFAVFKEVRISLKNMLIIFLWGALFEFLLIILQLVNKHSLQGIFYFFGERYLNLSMPGIAKVTLQGREFLRPYGTFSHPNSLAGFYLLLYFFFYNNPKLKAFWFNNLFFGLLFLIILFSFSKTALFVFLLIQFFYLFKNESKHNFCLPCFFSKLFLLIALIAIFASAKTDPLTLEKRYLLVLNALQIISHYPLLGVGLGNYLPAQAKLPTSFVSFPYQPVHNIFLLFTAETGIVSFLAVVYFGLKKFLSARKNTIFVVCCLVVALTGLLDHYWLTLQQNFLLLGVIWGVLAADLEQSG